MSIYPLPTPASTSDLRNCEKYWEYQMQDLVHGSNSWSTFSESQFSPLDNDLICTILNICGLTKLTSPSVQLFRKSILGHGDQVCLYLTQNFPSHSSCFSSLRRPLLCSVKQLFSGNAPPFSHDVSFLEPCPRLMRLLPEIWPVGRPKSGCCTPDVCVMAHCSSGWSVDYLGPIFNPCLLPPWPPPTCYYLQSAWGKMQSH